MSNHEPNPHDQSPDFFDPEFDFEAALNESFRTSTLNEIYGLLAEHPEVQEDSAIVERIAGHDPSPQILRCLDAMLAKFLSGGAVNGEPDPDDLAEGFAHFGLYDRTMQVIANDPANKPGENYQTTFNLKHIEKIPEAYLPQALAAAAALPRELAVDCLFDFGYHHPAVRPFVIETMRRVLQPSPDNPEDQASDRTRAWAVTYMSNFGDFSAARKVLDTMESPEERLTVEASIVEDYGALLAHGNLQDLYQSLVAPDSGVSAESQARAMLMLKRAGLELSPSSLLERITVLEPGRGKLELLSAYAEACHDPSARALLMEQLQAGQLKKHPYPVLQLTQKNPGLLAGNTSLVLSTLMEEGEDLDRLAKSDIATALLKDLANCDQIDEAIAIAADLQKQPYFSDDEQRRYKDHIVRSIARKGREHLPEAFEKISMLSRNRRDEFDDRTFDRLMLAFVGSADEYLTAQERESYLQSRTDEVTFYHWLQLAREKNRADYLIMAKKYLAFDDALRPEKTILQRLEILDVYKDIQKR